MSAVSNVTMSGGTLTQGNVASKGYAMSDKAEFASGSLLMLEVSTTGAGAIIGSGTSILAVDDGAKRYCGNATANKRYTVTRDFVSMTRAGWNGHVTNKDIQENYPNIIPVNALYSLTPDVKSESTGIPFLSRAMEPAYQSSASESMVNEVSRAAVAAGVQNTALSLADAGTAQLIHHLSLSFFSKENNIHKDGVDICATPMYGNTCTHGMIASGNYVGVILNADAQVGEILGGKMRAGAAVNGGGGKSETRGTSIDNEYNCGGVNLYAGWNLLNVMAGLDYAMVNHNVNMNLPASMGMGQAKADVVDMLPHAGVRHRAHNTESHDLRGNGCPHSSVAFDTRHIVQFLIGVTMTKNRNAAGWNVKPQAVVSVMPAAGDKENMTKVSYAGINAWDSVNTRIMDSTSFGGMVSSG